MVLINNMPKRINYLILISTLLIFGFQVKAAVMPAVYVETIQLEKTDFEVSEEIRGSFTIWNAENRAVNGINLKYVLLSKNEEGLPEVFLDEQILPAKFNLLTGEKKNFSISYKSPINVNSGKYSFRVTLLLSGFPLGWEEKEINLAGKGRFLFLDEPFIIRGSAEKSPLTGVVFGQKEEPYLKFTVSNLGKEQLTAIPKITIFERAASERKIESFNQPEISLKAQQSLKIIYSLPIYQKPESYLAEIQLFGKDDQLLSNQLFFRWVVSGLGGEIIEVSLDKENYQKGEEAKVNLLITGPADMTTDPGQGQISIDLLSAENIVAGSFKKAINLNEKSYSFIIPIEKDVAYPLIKVELKKDNLLLDDYLIKTGAGSSLPSQESEKKLTNNQFYSLILTALVLIFVLFYFLSAKGKNMKMKKFLILIGTIFFFFGPLVAKAAVTEFDQGFQIFNTWNRPVKDQTFAVGGNITFQGTIISNNCLNMPLRSDITFYITDFQQQPAIIYSDLIRTAKSEQKKNEILNTGNWIELGKITKKSNVIEYKKTFKIPDDAPRGNVYARIWFETVPDGGERYKFNLIVSENIKIIEGRKINNPPSAKDLGIRQPDYCLFGPAAIFSWQFEDSDSQDTQSAYQVQIDEDSDFSSIIEDSGKVISSSGSYSTPQGKLNYNTTYYWRLKVWDTRNAESDWILGSSFLTPLHAYPAIDFSWLPESPKLKQNTQFTDKTKVYSGATKSNWYWTFGSGEPANSSQANPLVKFLSEGLKEVTLKVTDSEGYSCLESKSLIIKRSLPAWSEVPPY